MFVALESVDMRKGFEGLHAAVQEKLQAEVGGGALFALHQQEAHAPESATGTRPGCRSSGLDPWQYLRDTLAWLPTMTNRQIAEASPEA